MNILAIDTTNKKLSVVLRKNYIDYYEQIQSDKHLITLLPTIDLLMDKAQLSMENIDIIAVCVGPGSFTGIRIGVATAKGLCESREIKTIPINNFELIAYTNFVKNGDKNIVVVIPSTLNKVYCADWNLKQGLHNIDVKSLDEVFASNVGDKKIVSYVDMPNVQRIDISEKDLLTFVEELIKANKYGNFEPYYVALSQAENELNKRGK